MFRAIARRDDWCLCVPEIPEQREPDPSDRTAMQQAYAISEHRIGAVTRLSE
jgi:hypothetical protein